MQNFCSHHMYMAPNLISQHKHIIVLHDHQTETPTCWTDDEAGGGDPCIFPFWVDGKEHKDCTWAEAFTQKNGKAWCATTNTSDGHVYSDTDWGNCKWSCLAEGENDKETVLKLPKYLFQAD